MNTKNKSPEQTVDGWTPVAALYAEHIDPYTGLYAEHALNIIPVGENDRILDVAAGAGALAIRAARLGADVTAIDFTPTLVDILNERAAEEGLDNLQAKVMDGQDLDFEDNSFDTGFSVFGLMLFPDRVRGFSELQRVLKPGAKAVIVTWDAPPNNEWLAAFQKVIQTAFPNKPPTKMPSFLEVANKDRLAEEMSDGGFKNVDVTTWSGDGTWGTSEQAWAAIARSNPIFGPLIDKIGEDGKKKLHATFDEHMKEKFGDGPIELNAGAHFAIGTA